MSASSDDILFNWTNSLRKTDAGERMVIAQQAINLRRDGYTADEAVEIIASNGMDLNVTNQVVKSVYAPAAETTSEDQLRPEPKVAMVVPTSYRDVVPIIERALSDLGPKAFVDKLTRCQQPIIRASDKKRESWVRLAENAVASDYGMAVLHEELRPWVENTMYDSVLLAENTETRVQTAAAKGRYVVSTTRETVEVDLEQGLSNGARFTGGNFADFGLADEHIICAAMAVSPYERLKRVIAQV